jgi:hypothetical protein
MSSFDSLSDVAIVGAGPYGLSLASHLTDRGLDWHFQSSVPGLHFVGFASAFSFGPLFRFVAGAACAAPALAHRLGRTAGSLTAATCHPAALAGG